MRQEVQVVYVTIKLKGLNQRFEESDEGDRQMGFSFIVVITIKYLQLINMWAASEQRAIESDIQ